MPRHKYLGKLINTKSRHNENYVETQVTFHEFANSPKAEKIEKPDMQSSLEEERVDSMVNEYLDNPNMFCCKDKIVIADYEDNWLIMDGQHRLNMIKELYNKHQISGDSHKFTLCWYKVESGEELHNLFTSLNKDSKKNEYYISTPRIQNILITSFTKLLNQYYKKQFNKKKSSTSRIYTIEEFRDKLIENDFFSKYPNYTAQKLLEIIKNKNNEFYKLNRYDVEISNNPDTFYAVEKKIIEDEFIVSLKNNNFIKWLINPDIKPIHIRKKTKKKIPSAIRKKVWDKEFPNESTGICTISWCDTELHNGKNGFEAGHIISEANGGDITVNNLRPICSNCNSEMGSKNWKDHVSEINRYL